jgi:NAD-dependent dihydropyrimidine dehydrogenase PreA subunit
MSKAEKNVSSKTLKDLNELFLATASSFAEQLIAWRSPDGALTNAFGRPIRVSTTVNLERLMGMASSGLRCAALIRSRDLRQNLSVLEQFYRLHIPISIVVDGDALSDLPELSRIGCIVFQAHDYQSLADRILQAQVISEKSLIPVVVIARDLEAGPVTLPRKVEIMEWYGDPDGKTAKPTEAQRIVMGNYRRRMPAWIHQDMPVLLGARKNLKDEAYENAARALFERSHIESLIDDSEREYEALVGRRLRSYRVYGHKSGRNLVITDQVNENLFDGLSDRLKKKRIKLISYDLLTPFIIDISDRIDRCERLLVVEKYKNGSNQGWMYRQVLGSNGFVKAGKQNAWYHREPDMPAMESLLDDFTGKMERDHFWIDVPFEVDSSQFPKHQIMLEEIRRAHPEVSNSTLKRIRPSQQPVMGNPIPEFIKTYQDKGAPYTRLNRFYTDTTCLYGKDGEEMVADPFQAIPVMPPLSFGFHSMAEQGDTMTAFDASKCTACGACLTACPHAALPATVLSLEGLIKAGIKMARDTGETIGAIIPAVKIWSKTAAAMAVKAGGGQSQAEELLTKAFAPALKVAKGDKEKIANLNREFKLIMEAIGDIPVAVTEELFIKQESAKAGSGELFTLAVDPDSCTSCGWCIERCEPGALYSTSKKEAVSEARGSFVKFQSLPETTPASIEARKQSGWDPFEAELLGQRNYFAFLGKDVRFKSPHEIALLRMIFGSAEGKFAADAKENEKSINQAMTKLNDTIKKLLSDALPVRHLDSLMEVIAKHTEEKLSMNHIFEEWGEEEAFKEIERADLQRKLQIAEALKQWKWSIKEGLNGNGRAPYSVIVDPSLDHLSQYPWNPFKVPVIQAEGGHTAEMVMGLFEGQLRHQLDNIKLLRRAELEATKKYDPKKHDQVIAQLDWKDLSDEERAFIAPIFVLGTQELLDELGGKTYHELFSKSYPVRVIILEDTHVRTDAYGSDLNFMNQALWPVVAQKNVFVAKTALHDATQAHGCLMAGLGHNGPAVISFLAPDPLRIDIDHQRWYQLARLAVDTKAYIPWCFDPASVKTTVASGLSVELPEKGTYWDTHTISYTENEETLAIQYELSWADWAYMDKEWASHFEPIEKDDTTVTIAAYQQLDDKTRVRKVPVIHRVNTEGELSTYKVSEEVLRVCGELTKNLDVLREWAGMFNEFPEKVQERVQSELQKEFDTEKKKLLAELAKEKKGWESETIERIKAEMKETLLKLSGY